VRRTRRASREQDATHLTVSTMSASLSLQWHLEAIQRFREVVRF
jgi:hypothetical protein